MQTINEILQKPQSPQEPQEKISEATPERFEAAKKNFWLAASRAARRTNKPEFVVDDENKAVVIEMIKYFAGIPCETLNQRQGVILCGNVGSGKTMLFNIFFDLMQPYYKGSAREIAKEYAEEGIVILKKYVKKFKQTSIGLQPVDYFFDDLGAEDNRKHYGNEANCMAEIICDRYDLFTQYGTLTHFTTNLTEEEIDEKYGERVISRLKQMCVFLKLGGTADSTDRRK